MKFRSFLFGIWLCLAVVGLLVATRADSKTYRVKFVSAHDVDTFQIDRMAFDDQMQIRIEGVNGPELDGAQCPEERAAAVAGRDFLNALGAMSSVVILPNPKKDKFGGRWRSKKMRFVVNGMRVDPATAIIAVGHGVEYHGEKRDPLFWCARFGVSGQPVNLLPGEFEK